MSQDEERPLTLEEAVEVAAKKFDLYADLHAAKGTADAHAKAMSNRGLANEMRRALAAQPVPVPPDPGPERQMYFFVCGEIIFRGAEVEAPPCTMKLNCVILSRDGRFAVEHIARTQQTLQMHFHKRMEDPELVVLDCVVNSLMPLGYFTPEEFNKTPSGMALQPVAQTMDELEQMLKVAGVDVATAGNA